uniref:Uncharacterized protein n=1 Tax=Oryza meridionalis TaxID=40149 RepID=A0A0E0EXJ1_9ORYZ
MRRATQRVTVARPRFLPGQTRRPAPNGARRRSLPRTSTSAPPSDGMNRSGANAAGSAHTSPSWVMAHMFTIAVVPAGTTMPLASPTSAVASRAQLSSGPGGCALSVSFTTACRTATMSSSVLVGLEGEEDVDEVGIVGGGSGGGVAAEAVVADDTADERLDAGDERGAAAGDVVGVVEVGEPWEVVGPVERAEELEPLAHHALELLGLAGGGGGDVVAPAEHAAHNVVERGSLEVGAEDDGAGGGLLGGDGGQHRRGVGLAPRLVRGDTARGEEYSPLGANPMARANSSSRAERFSGRSANDGCASTSLAVAGHDDTTAGVSPTENAMSSLALGAAASRDIASSARCGRPRESAKMLPNTGSPRGPAMGVAPRRPRPCAHAGPPGDAAQASTAAVAKARRTAAASSAGWAQRVSAPRSAGRAYAHHVASAQEEAVAIAMADTSCLWFCLCGSSSGVGLFGL